MTIPICKVLPIGFITRTFCTDESILIHVTPLSLFLCDVHISLYCVVQSSSGLGPEAAQHHVTKILIGAREDIKYSPRAIILLIGLQIVDIKQLDDYLTKVHGYIQMGFVE